LLKKATTGVGMGLILSGHKVFHSYGSLSFFASTPSSSDVMSGLRRVLEKI